MSQILESTIQDAERLILSFFSASVGTISSVSIFAIQALETAHLKHRNKRADIDEGGEKTFQRFKELVRKHPPEEVCSIRVLDSQVEDYKRFLKEKRKIFVLIDDLETDSKIIMFRGRDRAVLENIKDLVDTIHVKHGEIEPKTFLQAYENQDLSYVSGLNRSEAELFRYHIKSTPCLFAMVETGHDSYTVLHKPEDKDKIKSAMHQTNWSLRGSFGERVKEQVAYHLEGHNKINLDLEDAKKEFYIISKNNPKNFLHVGETDITYYKNDMAIVKAPRSAPDAKARTFSYLDAISAPVVLTPDDFSMDIAKRQQALDEKQSLALFPDEMQVEEEMQEYNRMRQRMSEKMGLDNENEADWALYDTAISYSEFDTHEHLDDQDAKIYKQKEFNKMKETFKDTETRFTYDDITVDRQSLDYVIAQIQNEKTATNERSETKFHQKDITR